LIKDKVVLLSFFYTSCTYVCQLQGDNLSKVQSRLGARLGKDIFLISISMDAKTDTPEKLKHWSRAVSARPGWTLVSSSTPEMNKMIEDFTGNNPGPKEVHSSVVFIGNDKTGKRIATDGLTGPEGLVKLLSSLMGNTVPLKK
jgi:protein SCO1/2